MLLNTGNIGLNESNNVKYVKLVQLQKGEQSDIYHVQSKQIKYAHDDMVRTSKDVKHKW